MTKDSRETTGRRVYIEPKKVLKKSHNTGIIRRVALCAICEPFRLLFDTFIEHTSYEHDSRAFIVRL